MVKKSLFLSQPGLTDTPEYTALHDLIAKNGIILTRSLQAYRQAADELTVRVITDKRAQGQTWEQIGFDLGMTRQGAQQFFKRAKK